MKNEICPPNAVMASHMRVLPLPANQTEKPFGVTGRIVLALAAGLLAASAGAGVLHVSTTGVDSPTCGAQGSPCLNIDQAVKIAANGDLIKVAGGTYTYANVGNPCASSPVVDIVCVSSKSLTIRGGFTPGTFAFNPGANPTVIDGQNIYRAVYVYTSAGIPARLTMANFTIQNGRSAGDPAGSFGGGMNVDGAAVTLNAMTFQSNQAVGVSVGASAGGSAAGSALSIRSTAGGLVSMLTGLTFTSNSSTGGVGTQRGGYAFGALFIYSATVHVENSSFNLNTAAAGSSGGTGDLTGTKADALGGAIAAEFSSTVTLSRVTATSNTVTGGAGTTFGGGAFGGGIYSEDSNTSIADSRVQSNVAQAGNRNPGTGG